jgi:hypothetical protein
MINEPCNKHGANLSSQGLRLSLDVVAIIKRPFNRLHEISTGTGTRQPPSVGALKNQRESSRGYKYHLA